MINWQPIETAPKDGTHILGYGELTEDKEENESWLLHYEEIWWEEQKVNVWKNQDERTRVLVEEDWSHWTATAIYPTHWMPLPSPPHSC